MNILIISCLLISSMTSAIGFNGNPVVEPSDAFPSDTLVYLEVSEPAAKLDMLSRMAFWPDVLELLSEMPGPFSELATWKETPELGNLMGDRIAIGWTPIPTLEKPSAVFAFRGCTDAVSSLASMVNRVEKVSTVRSTSEKFDDYFWIADQRGRSLLVGREVNGWLIFTTPKAIDVMESVAATLASESPPPYEVLAESEDFTDAMAGLPSTGVRGYINIPRFRERVAVCPMLSPMAKRMAKACLSWTSGIGVAREIHPGGIRTWVSGKMLHDEIETMVPGLVGSMYSIGTPLSSRLPANALCTYEVGIAPRHIFTMVDWFLKESFPWLHKKLSEHHREFITATGLDPATDLLPYLQYGVAEAWLPAADPKEWPFPRVVVLTRITDGESVKHFLDEFVRWKAGALAPFTQGLLGAIETREIHEGVELRGLKLDCVFNLPMPSPTFAVVGDLLVVSNIRSAAKEAVSALHGNAPVLTGESHPEAIELIHLDPQAWQREWESLMSRGLPFFDRALGILFEMDPERVKRVLNAAFRMLGKFEPATGFTVIDGEGRFSFYMEARLR